MCLLVATVLWETTVSQSDQTVADHSTAVRPDCGRSSQPVADLLHHVSPEMSPLMMKEGRAGVSGPSWQDRVLVVTASNESLYPPGHTAHSGQYCPTSPHTGDVYTEGGILRRCFYGYRYAPTFFSKVDFVCIVKLMNNNISSSRSHWT